MKFENHYLFFDLFGGHFRGLGGGVFAGRTFKYWEITLLLNTYICINESIIQVYYAKQSKLNSKKSAILLG